MEACQVGSLRPHRFTRWLVAVATSSALAALSACGGGGDLRSQTTDEPTPVESERPSQAPTSTVEPSPTTTQAKTTTTEASALPAPAREGLENLGAALSSELGGIPLPEPELECFAAAIEGLPPGAKGAFQSISDDPESWNDVDGGDALPLAQAYLGCGDVDQLLRLIIIGAVNVFDESECVVAAWHGKLTPDVVAASLAYGDGLDDLPPALARELAAEVIGCWTDRAWWIADLALEIAAADTDFTDEQAQCAATAYVDTLGIERAVERRILTIPVLSLVPEDQQRLNRPGNCGIDFDWPTAELGAVLGQCLARFGLGAGSLGTEVVGCAGPHNAEVINLHDLEQDFAEWPGNQVIVEHAVALCEADAGALEADLTGYGYGWDYPPRTAWERGERVVTCVLVRENFSEWEGRSELVPEATAPASDTTAPAAAGGLDAGDAIEDVNELAVGQCIDGSELLDPSTTNVGVLTLADCSGPHDAEVFHTFDMAGEADAPFPGDEVVSEEADDGCETAFAGYVGIDYLDSRLLYSSFVPDEATWRKFNDRRVICYLFDPNLVELTSPMHGAAE